MNAYDDARVDGAKTLGDSYRHCERDPEAFIAGCQYALDSVLSKVEHLGIPVSSAYIDSIAAEVLRRAIRGEPQ